MSLAAARAPELSTVSLSQALITGVYRTGTEFVSLLLSGHPELASTMYHVNAARFVRGRYEPLSDPVNLERATADLAARLAERYGLALDRSRVAAQARRAADRPEWAAIYDAAMTDLWLGGTRHHWIEKCQLLWREIPEFIAAMPNGRAILVVRDPRSVLASFKRHTYAPAPAYLGAIFNCFDAMVHGLRFAHTLPSDRFKLVRYEDVAAAPESRAAELFAFLGLDPAKATFDRCQWRDSLNRPWKANSSFDSAFSGEFDVSASIVRWRQGLDEAEIALTEIVCGAPMRRFSYEPSGKPLDWPAALRLFIGDETMTGHFRRWLLHGEGIEAFPTDPTDPSNWEERQRHSDSEGNV